MLKFNSSILLLVCSCLGACKEVPAEAGFDLEGTSTIAIVNQTNDSLRVEVKDSWTIVPFEEQTLDTSIAPLATLSYSLKTQGKKHYKLRLNQTEYRLFTQPQANDTVVVQYSLDSDSITFAGDSQSINRFLLEKQMVFGSVDADWMPRTGITRQAKNFSELAAANDSITQIHLTYLKQQAPTLPAAYVTFETNRLKFLNAGFTTNSSFYRSAFLDGSDTVPADYLDNLGEVQNPDMLGSLWYYQFLKEYVSIKTGRKLFLTRPTSPKEIQNRVDSSYATAKRELTGQVRDVYFAAGISRIIDGSRHVLDTTWITLIEDEDLQDFLHNYLEAHQILPEGAEAPYFSLPAMDSIYYESTSFRGQVVLINFWATWCKPCYQEFAHENALVEKFADDPVAVINICVDSEPDKWREVVSEYQLKTLNLTAPDNWNNLLKEKFDIDALPHSVLIDQNGKIVCNKCPRPSQGIEAQIAALLESGKPEHTNRLTRE